MYSLESIGTYLYDIAPQYFCDDIKPARTLESLRIGEVAERSIKIEKWRVFFFALVSGDCNRLHLDRAFAEKTRFKGPIGHGLLEAGVASAILGMDVPGLGTYYVSQFWQFKGPARLGAEVAVRLTVTAVDLETRRVTLLTEARVAGRIIATGEAVAGIDDFPYEK